jgi:hypothetical protein
MMYAIYGKGDDWNRAMTLQGFLPPLGEPVGQMAAASAVIVVPTQQIGMQLIDAMDWDGSMLEVRLFNPLCWPVVDPLPIEG